MPGTRPAEHTDASYSEPLFLAHLLGGIMYAAGPGKSPAATTTPAAPVPPKILSLTTSLRGRRIVVTVRASGCRPCSAKLLVGLPGRFLTSQLHFDDTSAHGTTAVLPPGRRRLTVVVTDPATGLSTTARRWARIR